MQGFFHQQYEYGKFNPLNALHLLHSEVTPPPLRHNVSLDRFGLSTYPEPRYLHTKTPTEVHPRKIRTSVGPSPGATQQNHLSNPIIEKLFKKSHTKFYPPGKLTKFPGYFYSVRWLFNKPLPWNWICDSVPWRLCQFCQRFQGEKKFSKALGAWLLVRGVSQRKRRRRGRRRYFPWRGCALPRCNLRGGGFMRTESGGFENTLSLLRIICSLIIIITKTVKIDSIENLYWMCFHCVLCLGSIGNISEHVLYGTLPMAVKQSDGCLEKDLSLWRQGRGNRDKFSHNVELSPAKVNEKRLFFLPDQTYSQKGPNKKPRESWKKAKQVPLLIRIRKNGLWRMLQKIRPCWIGGWRFGDTCFFGYLPWPGDICVEVSALEKCRNVEPSIYADGKKNTHQQIWTIYGSYEAQKL